MGVTDCERASHFFERGAGMKRGVFLAVVLAIIVAATVSYAGDLGKLKTRLANELNAKDYTSASATIAELGDENSLDAVKVIVSIALNERIDSREIFQAAKEALSRTTNAEAVSFLCSQARKSRDWRLKALLAEVLGDLTGNEVRDALISLLDDRQPEVVREAVKALSKLKDIEAVDKLIDTLERTEKEKGLVWVEIRKALTSLTGYDYDTAVKWREFWRVRKEELKANPGSPETAKPVSPDEVKTGLLEEEKRKAPKFFGKEIMSKRIVFVIDVSGSMIMKDRDTAGGEAGDKGQQGGSEYSKMPENRMRILRAKNELKKAVAGLPTTAKFNIIAFANYVSAWQKKKLVYATSKNKKAALTFVDKFVANGGTFTDDALKEAFGNEEMDTMFFLSDGAPERYGSAAGQENPQNAPLIDECLDFVRTANKFRKVKIYAFGFDGEGVWDPNRGTKPAYHQKVERFVSFMRKLAQENGGEYKSLK